MTTAKYTPSYTRKSGSGFINFQLTLQFESYPHLPDWYQKKMKMSRMRVFKSVWEEINPSWYYLGM